MVFSIAIIALTQRHNINPQNISSHIMRVLATIPILLFSAHCFGQKNGYYSDFSSAFQNVDSVESISINCMNNNEFNTDGCDSLPMNIGKFHNMTSLHISESDFSSLPNSIIALKKLKKLYLNLLYYFNYETELCKLQGLDSLEYLSLWMLRIETLPSCVGQIKSLRHIDISQNGNLNIKKAFETFKQLPNLETLNLSSIDNLRVLPKDINEVRNLKSIQLNYFRSKFDFKTSFDRLSYLSIKSLSLTNNYLDELPSTISKLKELEYIDLSDNHFDSIPKELFELTKLKHIKIQFNNNSFTNVSAEITKLTNLETINFGNNWMQNGQQVIVSLSKLPNLKDLILFGCHLDTIPNEAMNFPALEKLNLDGNPKIDFADLFKKLSSVKTLKYLDISDNNLTTLPKEIGLLTSLECLIIGRNSISTLPEEFFDLSNLKVLNVYGNYDKKISEAGLLKIRERLPSL